MKLYGIEILFPSNGKFIAFPFDSDDESMFKDKLIQPHEAEAIQKNSLVELPKSCFSRLWRRCNASKWERLHSTVSNYLFVSLSVVNELSLFIHREDLKDIRFDESIAKFGHQDYDLLLHIGTSSRCRTKNCPSRSCQAALG